MCNHKFITMIKMYVPGVGVEVGVGEGGLETYFQQLWWNLL